jgi:PadR family transcriptional regulator
VKVPRRSPETLRVLEMFLQRPTEWVYGYELVRSSDLKSGTLYPILMRLEKYALLEARWVATENGVPPRHTYRLTPQGREFAKARLAEARPLLTERQPAFCTGLL